VFSLAAAITLASASSGAPPEPVTLKGHTGWVGGVAFSPDGKALATASADGTVKFWDAATGKELATLKAHDDIVAAVAFSKDGTRFATASFDGTAKVWTTAKRELVHTLRGARGALLTVAFNPNGRALAAGGIDGRVRVWELDGKQEPDGRVQRTHGSWVNALAYRPDGEGLASVSSDNEVRFNPSIGKLVTVRPRLAEVRSVAYSPDGKLLATGTRYGVTKVWDEAGDEVATLKGKHTGDVWGVAFSHDGKLLAVGDGDWNKPSDIVLYDTTTWKERARLKHTNEVLCVAFHPKRLILAAGAWDKAVKVWDLTDLLKVER
jgi:WD40 repeat protein